ncbi:MAG: extracellular solute-binding protein [Gammaproteobacteria bacterium]|nr:extracellular solute-binding protein [Gammaproteobacteria bacterium]
MKTSLSSLARRFLTAALAFGFAASPTHTVAADLPYALKAGQPYAGTTIKILSVVTPQFDGLRLRDPEFTELTGIKTQWTFIPFASLQEKVAAVGVAADGSYDVVNYLDSWGPPNAHWLVPIDERLEADGISMDRYPPAFAQSASFEGRTLGFPLRAHAQLLFYRTDVLKALAMAPPKSWDDVIAIGQAIRAKNVDIEPIALYYHNDGNRQALFIWLNFLWAAGADVFDANHCPIWASEAGLKASEDYVGLHTVQKVTNPASLSFVEQDARQSFNQGKSAMIPVWWWAYSSMTNPKSSVLNKSQVAFTGMPTYQGKAVTYAISMPFSISKYSNNQDAAWEFMKWLSNPQLEKRNATEREVGGKKIVNNVVTHIANLQDEDVNKANDRIQQAAWDSLKESSIMPQIAQWPEVADIIAGAIAKAAGGGNTRALMSAAAKRATKVLRRAGHCR